MNHEPFARASSQELDSILGVQFKVLDDGFVRVVDYMGSDASIVQAARVSYGAGTKAVHEDKGLIRYLMRHRHTTPFEMCEIKLHIRVPMDCWRQWIRHRTASVNEYSTRYSLAIDRAQRTEATDWRSQSIGNRQGSSVQLPSSVGVDLTTKELALHTLAREVYEERIKQGVAREQARKDLPLATYTEAYWKIDLHNLLHFLALRMDAHAQHEIRQYATAIGSEFVKRWCPLTWSAFVDYRLEATTLSKLESLILKALVSGNSAEALHLATDAGLVRPDGSLPRSREREDLEKTLTSFGLSQPWRTGNTND